MWVEKCHIGDIIQIDELLHIPVIQQLYQSLHLLTEARFSMTTINTKELQYKHNILYQMPER